MRSASAGAILVRPPSIRGRTNSQPMRLARSTTATAFVGPCALRSFRPAQILFATPHLPPTCCIAPRRAQVMQDVLQYLRDTTPNTFAKGVTQDYSKYSPHVQFTDPLNNFNGIDRHAANIDFLCDSFVFCDATLDYHDIRVLPPSASPFSDVIRARWSLCMTFRLLPWKPRLLFSGLTDYVVDIDSGQIARHIDFWDSLADSSYFSFPALNDFVSMCLPSYPVPFDVAPDFKLLLRTDSFQIWRFVNPVSLSKISPSSYIYSPSSPVDQDEAVRLVAIAPLPSNPPPSQFVSEMTASLLANVNKSGFATTGTRTFCVRLDSRPPTYHVWVELVGVRLDAN